MNVKAELVNIFDGMGFPCWLMHTMPEDEKYPESFFTFLCTDAPFQAHYDNKPSAIVWTFWIGFYSSNPESVRTVPNALAARLRAAGWIVDSPGVDVESDEPTHTGRRITAVYVEPYEEQEG